MKDLSEKDLVQVAGGDRWGDGQDQINHPDNSPGVTICTPMPPSGSWEVCVVLRVVKTSY
jgi:hypothetical protein